MNSHSLDVIRSLRPGGAYTTRKIGLGFIPETGRTLTTEAELEAALLLVEVEPQWWALDMPPIYTEAIPVPDEGHPEGTMDDGDPQPDETAVWTEGDSA